MSFGLTAIYYGAAGGLITEAVDVWQRLRSWRQARQAALIGRKPLPGLAPRFIDPAPDLCRSRSPRSGSAICASWLLHTEITGMYAALAVGASAPALLAGLGKATAPAQAIGGQTAARRLIPPARPWTSVRHSPRRWNDDAPSFAHRYWSTLAGHRTLPLGRAAAFTFWQRYQASFTITGGPSMRRVPTSIAPAAGSDVLVRRQPGFP